MILISRPIFTTPSSSCLCQRPRLEGVCAVLLFSSAPAVTRLVNNSRKHAYCCFSCRRPKIKRNSFTGGGNASSSRRFLRPCTHACNTRGVPWPRAPTPGPTSPSSHQKNLIRIPRGYPSLPRPPPPLLDQAPPRSRQEQVPLSPSCYRHRPSVSPHRLPWTAPGSVHVHHYSAGIQGTMTGTTRRSSAGGGGREGHLRP